MMLAQLDQFFNTVRKLQQQIDRLNAEAPRLTREILERINEKRHQEYQYGTFFHRFTELQSSHVDVYARIRRNSTIMQSLRSAASAFGTALTTPPPNDFQERIRSGCVPVSIEPVQAISPPRSKRKRKGHHTASPARREPPPSPLDFFVRAKPPLLLVGLELTSRLTCPTILPLFRDWFTNLRDQLSDHVRTFRTLQRDSIDLLGYANNCILRKSMTHEATQVDIIELADECIQVEDLKKMTLRK
jgi:hypothetical protein